MTSRPAFIVLAASAAVLCLAAPASAQNAWYNSADTGQTGVYANGGYTHFDDSTELGGLTGRLGYRFHPNFGVEGEASFGVKNDRVGPAKIELDHEAGVYGVGFVPLSPNVDLIGRVGYAKTEYSSSVPGARAGRDQDGVAYGGGAQVMVTPQFGVRGDYTRIEGGDDSINTLSATGVVKF